MEHTKPKVKLLKETKKLTKTKLVLVITLLSLLTLSAFSAINTNAFVQAVDTSFSGSGQIAAAKFVQSGDTIHVYFAEQLKIGNGKPLAYGLYIDVTHGNGETSADYVELSLVDTENFVTFESSGIHIEAKMTFSRGSTTQEHNIILDWDFADSTAIFTLINHRAGRTSVYNANGDNVAYAFVNPSASASVFKGKGNTNTLAITIAESCFDFVTNAISAPLVKEFTINNNAAGTYQVDDFNIYVDTKGNDQIRACYIITK